MNQPWVVDWEYLRVQMRNRRGGGSYRDLANLFPVLSLATCHRFLVSSHELDLRSLLCVMDVLDLEVSRVIIRRAKQTNLFER